MTPRFALALASLALAGCQTTGYVDPNRDRSGGWVGGGGWENFRAGAEPAPSLPLASRPAAEDETRQAEAAAP
ncbi:MAG: hypothetical protein ACOY4R_09555 [Pseudomonadota bacterium]